MYESRLARTKHLVDLFKRFQREVSMWRGFKHPNVVPLYGIIYIEEDILSVRIAVPYDSSR